MFKLWSDLESPLFRCRCRRHQYYLISIFASSVAKKYFRYERLKSIFTNRFLCFNLGMTTKLRTRKQIINYTTNNYKENTVTKKKFDFLTSILTETIFLFNFNVNQFSSVRFKNRTSLCFIFIPSIIFISISYFVHRAKFLFHSHIKMKNCDWSGKNSMKLQGDYRNFNFLT